MVLFVEGGVVDKRGNLLNRETASSQRAVPKSRGRRPKVPMQKAMKEKRASLRSCLLYDSGTNALDEQAEAGRKGPTQGQREGKPEPSTKPHLTLLTKEKRHLKRELQKSHRPASGRQP